MAVIGNVNVAMEYSAVVEPNLYPDSTLVPNVTFNPNTIQGAGGRFIPKVANGGIVAPTLPGQDYSFTAAADTLVQIVTNNSLTPSKRIRNAQIASVDYPILEENIANLVSGSIKPSFNASGLACLINEGTVLSDTTALTEATLKSSLISLRKQLRDKGANGNVLIVSTAVYAMILSVAGAEFDNEVKNMINMEGGIGKWLGWVIIESNIFSLATAGKYYDYSGTLRTVDFTDVELIAYDWSKFYVDTLVEMLKAQDATTFNGVEIVSELINGYRVSNTDCVLVKKVAEVVEDPDEPVDPVDLETP